MILFFPFLLFFLNCKLNSAAVTGITQQLIGQRFMITATYTEDVYIILILFHTYNLIGYSLKGRISN